ncbi:MAG: hypothetical protein AAFY91_11180 [Bacteroidota bacterium]
MDVDFVTYLDLYNAMNGAMDLIFNYLVDLLGSADAAQHAIITEDLVAG